MHGRLILLSMCFQRSRQTWKIWAILIFFAISLKYYPTFESVFLTFSTANLWFQPFFCLKEWKRRFLFLDKILQFQPLWLLKSYLPTFFSFRSCTLVVMKTTTLHFYLMICLSTEASRAVFLIWPTKPALANFYPCQGILNEGFQMIDNS